MGPVASQAAFLLDVLGAVLAPPRCAACDAPVHRLRVFCSACASTVERSKARGEALAAFVYGGAVARAVTRFKYEGRPDLARPLGDLLWAAVARGEDGWRPSVLVPVPLHPSRLAERGYNQATLLASRLAWRLGAPVRAMALQRERDTPRQATLDRAARLVNVAGVFAVRQPRSVAGRAVLLVDDVRTTGSTLDACARALLDAGASAVRTAVLAQAE
jgi:ComF family protein